MNILKYILIILLLQIVLVESGHIFSQNTEIEYSYDSFPKTINIHFALSSGLKINNYIELFLPFQTNFNVANIEQITIHDFDNLQTFQIVNQDASSTIAQLYLLISQNNLESNKWYTLKIHTKFTIRLQANYPTLTDKPVIQIKTISSISDFAIYDMNLAFDYLNIQGFVAVEATQLNVAFSNSQLKLGTQQILTIKFTPTNIPDTSLLLNGYVYVLEFVSLQNSSNFTFGENCSLPGTSNINNGFCKISEDNPSVMYLFNPSKTSYTSLITIEAKVNYPYKYGEADLYLHIHPYDSNQLPVDQALQIFKYSSLNTGQIQIIDNDFTVLYGHSYNLATPFDTNTKNPIFYNVVDDQKIYNNIKFSFKITSQSYQVLNNQKLRVSVNTILNTGQSVNIQPLSISHNLGGQFVECVNNLGIINCDNVQFLKQNQDYYIYARVAYNLAAPISTGQYGQVSIKVCQNNNCNDDNTFISSTGKDITTIHTISQQNTVNGSWKNHIGNSQVLSVESSKDNSMAEQFKKVFGNNNQGIGIFPEKNYNQSLLFFLKINLSTIDEDFASNHMKLYLTYNKNIIDEETIGDGIQIAGSNDVVLDDANFSSFSFDKSVCYNTQEICQQYQKISPDKDQNGKITDQLFSYQQMRCGKTTSDEDDCNQMFAQTAKFSIISMNDVNFKPTFTQNNIKASDNNLDFGLFIYTVNNSSNDHTLKTGVLINGYTLSIRSDSYLINKFYVNPVNYNSIDTNFADSYFRIQGNKQNFGDFDKIGIFFDASVDFINNDSINNDYHCTVNCQAYQDGSYEVLDLNYLNNKVVIVQNEDLEEEFDFLITVVPNATIFLKYLNVVFFDKNFKIKYSFVPQILNIVDNEQYYYGFSQFPYAQKLTDSKQANGRQANDLLQKCYLTDNDTIPIVCSQITTWEYDYKIIGNKIVFKQDTATNSNINDFKSIAKTFGLVLASKGIDIFGEKNYYLKNELDQQKCFKIVRGDKFTLFCPTDKLTSISGTSIDNNAFLKESTIFNMNIDITDIILGQLNLQNHIKFGISNVYGISEGLQESATVQEYQQANSNPCYQFDTTQDKERNLLVHLDFNSNIPFQNLSTGGFKSITVILVSSATNIEYNLNGCNIQNSQNSFTCTIQKFSQAQYSCSTTNLCLQVVISSDNNQIIILSQVVIEIGLIDNYLNGTNPLQDINYDVYLFLPHGTNSDNLYGADYQYNKEFKHCPQQFTITTGNILLSPTLNSETFLTQYDSINSPTDIDILVQLQDISFIKSSDRFSFSYGFLGNTKQSLEEKFYCQVLKNGQLSFDFNIQQDITNSKLIIIPKNDMYDLEKIGIKCQGIQTSQYSSSIVSGSSPINIELLYNSALTVQEQISFDSYENPTNLDFTVTKQQVMMGQQQNYVFIITYQANISTFTQFIVQLPYGIPDYFSSKDGGITCKVDNLWAHCEFIGARLLKIYSNVEKIFDANNLNSNTVKVEILGVDNPDWDKITGLTNNYITVGIIQDYSVNSYKLNYKGIKANIITQNVIQNTQKFNLFYTQFTQIMQRGVTSYISSIQIPTGTNTSTLLIAEFYNLRNSFSIQPVCSVQEIGNTVQYVSSCAFISLSQLQITLTGNLISNKKYTISLTNMPYPNTQQLENYQQHEQLIYPYSQIKFKFVNANNSVVSVSNFISRLSYNKFQEIQDDRIDLQWQQIDTNDNILNNVAVVTYVGNSVKLVPKDGQLYQSSILMTVQQDVNQNYNKFNIVPQQLKAFVNDAELQIEVSAKSSTLTGPSVISFNKSIGTKYVQKIPDLYLITQKQTCTVQTEYSTYFVISGGSSWPIVLDFNTCKPIGTVSVQASLTTIVGEVVDFQQSLTYDSNSTQNDLKLTFYVKSSSLGVGTLNFVLNPSNINVILQPANIQVIENTNLETQFQDPVVTQSVSGTEYSFRVNCGFSSSQIDYRVYYVYHINKGNINYNQQDILDIIQLKGTGIVDDKYDPFRSYYSYYSYISQNTSIVMKELKANSNYRISAFCQNQLGDQSNIGTVTFDVPQNAVEDNLLRIEIQTVNEINPSLKRKLACSITSKLQVLRLQMISNEFIYCDDYEASLIENIVEQVNTQVVGQRRNLENETNNLKKEIQNINNYEYSPSKIYQEALLKKQKLQQEKQKNNQEFNMCDYNNIDDSNNIINIYKESQREKRILVEEQNQESQNYYSTFFYVSPIYDFGSDSQNQAILDNLNDPDFENIISQQILLNSEQQFPQIQKVITTQPDNKTIPKISKLQAFITNDKMQVVLRTDNNGFAYIAVDPRPYNNNMNHVQMLKGLNGNNLPFQYYQRQHIKQNNQVTFTINYLSDNQDYNVYLILSSEEPSNKANFDPQLYNIKFKIEKQYEIPQIDAQILKVSQTLMYFLIFIVFVIVQ